MIPWGNLLSFSSLRLLSLFGHFLLTTFLFWTRQPSIAVTLNLTSTQDDFIYAENSYLALLSFALFLLIIELFTMLFNIERYSFRSVLFVGLNFAAMFFIAWIALEGLSWETYMYIFIFCV